MILRVQTYFFISQIQKNSISFKCETVLSGKTASNSITGSEKLFLVPTALCITEEMLGPYKWTS